MKTAWAGCDPNWGAGFVAAIGYSGAQIDPERIDIRFGELQICRDGGRSAEFDEAAAHAYISQREFSISIDLNQGQASCVFWTTDLTAPIYTHQRGLFHLARWEQLSPVPKKRGTEGTSDRMMRWIEAGPSF